MRHRGVCVHFGVSLIRNWMCVVSPLVVLWIAVTLGNLGGNLTYVSGVDSHYCTRSKISKIHGEEIESQRSSSYCCKASNQSTYQNPKQGGNTRVHLPPPLRPNYTIKDLNQILWPKTLIGSLHDQILGLVVTFAKVSTRKVIPLDWGRSIQKNWSDG